MKNKKDLRKKRRNDIAAVGLTMVVCTTVVGTSAIAVPTKKEKVDIRLTAGIAKILVDADAENIKNIKKECSVKGIEHEIVMVPNITTEVTTEAETEIVTEEPKQTYSEEDLYWLSHVIAAEVGNSTYESKAMCGLVVMNRVASSEYKATTIKEVIFSPGQYETVSNGKIYDEPDNESIEVARKILEGTIEIEIPADVVYQAEFPQGAGIYCQIGYEFYCFDD